MFEKTNKKELLVNLLIAPIIPLVLASYLIVVNVIDVNTIALIITALLGVIIYKSICIIRQYYERAFQILIVSVDWFMLDIIGIYTNEEFNLLKASILESTLKLSISYVI